MILHSILLSIFVFMLIDTFKLQITVLTLVYVNGEHSFYVDLCDKTDDKSTLFDRLYMQ